MSKPIVFVDTNTVDNRSSATSFLGGRSDLEKISKRADIILPRIVYDELCKHINGFLSNQRDSFRKNPHRHLLNIKDTDIDNIDHADIIESLVMSETIEFKIVDLNDELSAYREAYEHALYGTAPFESNGDKGFKDTLIAKTIDQFVLINPKREIFLMTNDIRLSDYFRDTRVRVISGFQEFDREYSDNKLEEVGVLDRIWSYFDEQGVMITERKAPADQWLNSEGDIVALFEEPEFGDVHVLLDAVAREPISYIAEKPAATIELLNSAASFQNAHEALAEADYAFAYFSLDNIKTITGIMLTNQQIYGISSDDDIAQFAAKLFSALDGNGETKLAVELRERYELNLLTKEELANLPF